MSVINQMLKDLEERNQPANEVSAGNPIIVNQPAKSTSSIVIVLVSVALSVLIAGAVWLYLENQKLQLNQKDVSQPVSQGNPAIRESATTQAVSELPVSSPVNRQALVNQAQDEQDTSEQAFENSLKKNVNANVEANLTANVDTVNSHDRVTSQKATSTESEANIAEPVQTSVSSVSDEPVAEIQKPSASEDTAKIESKPSLSIARKQLSPEQLAAQKMSQVDKAMMEGEGQKAEQLLQDVVLLTPMNTEARKQLAALWFAQGQLQGALNVLNQGVAVMPDFADFRLMKAKILLQQSNAQGAYQSLMALPRHPQIEYQSLLAQAAQQVGELSVSINAYRQLVLLQPSKGKWHLGLAIALDRNSQFGEAVEAYRAAIALGDISPQSRQFAQQRMTELGD
ncbi:MAG: tetratricopeptide repeat protein [Thalassotalea sp.]|nr:tetratricopeptide repeat protein [Thalassotalea sp.]